MAVSEGACHLSEEPVELHALGGGVAALHQARSAVHIHQALVVVVVDGGAEQPDVELLGTGVVHILQGNRKQPLNTRSHRGWHLEKGPSRAACHRTGNKPSSKWGSSPSMKEKTSTHWIYIHEICTFIQPSWPKAASPETRQRTVQRRSSLLIQGRKKGRKPGYLCPGITTNCFLQGQFIAHKELTKAENHWQELFWRVL